MRFLLILCVIAAGVPSVNAQRVQYPYEVKYLQLTVENKPVRMAYMDVSLGAQEGKNVVLLHGKNFNGFYWKNVIAFLNAQGYRVIVPDQLGFGMSDKPDIRYSFSLLAANTKKLLDTLGIRQVAVIGHSMGGMLAVRLALMYPETVTQIILENPVGLEDYRGFVPYKTIDEIFADERSVSYETLKRYQRGYYPEWKPEYEQYVAAQWAALQVPNLKTATWSSALTYDMMYQQPVVSEFDKLTQRTMLIIGLLDRTVVGKKWLPKEKINSYGQYPQLGRQVSRMIKHARLEELPGVGHIPHIQVPARYRELVLDFLNK